MRGKSIDSRELVGGVCAVVALLVWLQRAAKETTGHHRTQGARRGLDRRLRLIEERAHGTRAGRPRHTHRPRPHARLLSSLSEDGWVGYSRGGRICGKEPGGRGESIEIGPRSRAVGN